MAGYVTVEEMRALEANADYFGVGYADLMENAGRKVAELILSRYGCKATVVVCGRGNNGGDGFVAARYLAGENCPVSVVLLGRASHVRTGPASDNFFKLQMTNVKVTEADSVNSLSPELFNGSEIIVDAILGTGSQGPPRSLETKAIILINQSKGVKISVDVPSGLDCRTGICDVCVRSDLVITFHALKKGLEKFNVDVVDIGIPSDAILYAGPGDLGKLLSRGDFAHKGQSGRVLVIGGGPYTGAPALAAMAALRAGADLVTVAAPQRAADIIASFSPNLITRQLMDKNRIVEADILPLTPLIGSHDVVIIGMGAGRDPETTRAISGILELCDRTVIDADALLPGVPLKGIVTPHRVEFRRISGHEVKDGSADEVKAFSAARKVITLLKGKTDVISDGERVKLNRTGNAGMTVGGTGDVLAGIAGAFYCKNPPFEAAAAAAFISGAAGDIAFQAKGFGLIATDVIDCIPEAMKRYRHR